MIQRGGVFFVFLAAIVFLFSCRSERTITKTSVEEVSSQYVLNQMEDRKLNFDSFQAKISVRYTKGSEKTSFKGNIRIKKDSTIWVSIAPVLGIEIARIMVTPDSVKYINRHKKTYLKAGYNYVNAYLNNSINFNTLQAFLLGNDFPFFKQIEWNVKIDGNTYRIEPADENRLREYAGNSQDVAVPVRKTWLNPNTFKINKVLMEGVSQSSDHELVAKYNDFRSVSEQLFPLEANYELRADKNLNVVIDYSKVRLNKDLKFPFNISATYNQLQIKN
ncbi:MAG: DUF4292 domain-containing protein [Bacteroidales bacterium]|nr:DUF4292 domain-containing protein [Bacteroidales bacterium]